MHLLDNVKNTSHAGMPQKYPGSRGHGMDIGAVIQPVTYKEENILNRLKMGRYIYNAYFFKTKEGTYLIL